MLLFIIVETNFSSLQVMPVVFTHDRLTAQQDQL